MTDVIAPRVSVVVPVFNGEVHVGRALESIRGQDFERFEVIVVDDASTDHSAAVVRDALREFNDARLICLPNNLGAAAARNRALAVARGEFITFLDADDCMAPGRMFTQVEHLDSHPDVDIVIGKETVVVEDGAPVPEWLAILPPDHKWYYIMSMMVRRGALTSVGELDPQFVIAHDHDWLLRARAAGLKIDMVDLVFTRRFIHGSNLTYDIARMRAEMMQSLAGIRRRKGADGSRPRSLD